MSTAETRVAQHIDEAAWLAERRKLIGGSEVAALFGMHPFQTAHQVWLEKMGRAPERKVTPDMLRGRALEDVAVKLYEEKTGRKTRRVHLKRFADFPHLGASIDRQVFSKNDLPTSCLEVKAPRSRNFWKWKREGLPDYIVLQGQVEALVWHYEQTEFAIFGADDFELLTFNVPFDPDVSQRVIEVVSDWWHRHIELGEEPAENAIIPDLKELPKVEGSVVFRDDDIWQHVTRDYFEARELKAEAEATMEQAKARIKAAVGDVPGIYETRDVCRFYYSARDGKVSFDKKALEGVKPLDPLQLAAQLKERVPALSLDEIGSIVEAARLDLNRFNKRGQPYNELRGFLLSSIGE